MTLRFAKKTAVISAVIILLLAAGGIFYYIQSAKTKILSASEAAETAMNFINQSILPEGGPRASLIEVGEEEGLYKFRFKVGENEYTSYITKGGKYLFPDSIDLTSPI